ncbi:MAG: hypothetical protein K0S39_5023 [Paenibacillus sp.]|jgi:hypothetical protein|nr:hypothetical protein [Paenibacillus sp.]
MSVTSSSEKFFLKWEYIFCILDNTKGTIVRFLTACLMLIALNHRDRLFNLEALETERGRGKNGRPEDYFEPMGEIDMAKAKVAKRPTRDEFVLEEIGNQLTEAKDENAEVLLTVWGWEEQVRGLITEMDSRTGKVHIQRYDVLTKVPFMDIMKVDNPRD